MLASAESFRSDAGLVARIPLAVLWGFGAVGSLRQQSPAVLSFCVGAEPIMGPLRDSEDSVSACSKKTYFTARSRARPRVITCSRSILMGGETQSRHQWAGGADE